MSGMDHMWMERARRSDRVRTHRARPVSRSPQRPGTPRSTLRAVLARLSRWFRVSRRGTALRVAWGHAQHVRRTPGRRISADSYR